jgi:hypothetical protein
MFIEFYDKYESILFIHVITLSLSNANNLFDYVYDQFKVLSEYL